MRSITEIIEDAYVLFAPYILSTKLDVCSCCVSDAEAQALLTTPLRQVSRQLLQNSYYESARNHSDQERWEMKHFLPRVLELVSRNEFPCHSDEITFLRLDLNLPTHWPLTERKLLAEFALAYVKQCLQPPPPNGVHFADILVMFGIAHFELTPLLQAWTVANTTNSLLYFVDLLLDDIRILSNETLKFTNPFTEPHANQQLTTWLTNLATQESWKSQLEQVILQELLPTEQAERASWAYDILLHGLPGAAALR